MMKDSDQFYFTMLLALILGCVTDEPVSWFWFFYALASAVAAGVALLKERRKQ